MSNVSSHGNEIGLGGQLPHVAAVPSGFPWTITRFLVIVAAMTGLLYKQASDPDMTEGYSIIQLAVVLLAFEVGAALGSSKPERTNVFRLVVVLAGMAVLLFMNSQNFDSTEQTVLVGFPCLIAVFEGFRTWIQAKRGHEGREPEDSSESMLVLFGKVGRQLSILLQSLLTEYGKLPPSTKGLVVAVFTAILGSLFGISSSEVLKLVPQEEKPQVAVVPNDNPSRILQDAMKHMDDTQRQELLDDIVAKIEPGARIVYETGMRQPAPE